MVVDTKASHLGVDFRFTFRILTVYVVWTYLLLAKMQSNIKTMLCNSAYSACMSQCSRTYNRHSKNRLHQHKLPESYDISCIEGKLWGR